MFVVSKNMVYLKVDKFLWSSGSSVSQFSYKFDVWHVILPVSWHAVPLFSGYLATSNGFWAIFRLPSGWWKQMHQRWANVRNSQSPWRHLQDGWAHILCQKKRVRMAIVLDGFRGCRSLDTLGIVIMHGLEMSIMKTSHSTLGFTKRCLTLLGSGNGQLCAEIMNTWLGSFIAKFTETVGMFGLWFQIWFISIQTWIFRMMMTGDISGGSKTPRCCPSASPCQASHSRSLSIVANNVHDFQIAANKAVDSVPYWAMPRNLEYVERANGLRIQTPT